MLLADVSGHGPRVSKLAWRLRDLMRRHVNSISQARFVEGMNREFVELNAEGSFATAIVGTFFSITKTVELSVAGHPHPLVYRQKTGSWEIYDFAPDATMTAGHANFPLGILDSVTYEQSRLTLAPGDMLLAYTDGVTEMRIANGQLLETQGLLKLVQALDATRHEVLLKSLLAALQEQATAPVDDDLSLLLARADGSRPSLWDSVRAPFRFLRPVRDKTHLR